MSKDASFDIESTYDISLVDHAVDQARREIANRYDFKGTAANLEYLDKTKSGLKISGENQYQLESIVEILRKKLASQKQSQKILDTSSPAEQSGTHLTWLIPFQSGLDQDKAKLITNLLRDNLPKVKTQIQGETVRVTSAKKDQLQEAIALIKEQDFDWPLIFTNYR